MEEGVPVYKTSDSSVCCNISYVIILADTEYVECWIDPTTSEDFSVLEGGTLTALVVA